MTLEEFLAQQAGEWMSQRTSHTVATRASTAERLEVIVTALSAQDPSVRQLCEQQGSPAESAAGAIQTQWSSPSTKGSATLVLLPETMDPSQGQFVQDKVQGSFQFGADGVLTLTGTMPQPAKTLTFNERIWFANENFRIRASLIQEGDTLVVSSFFTEIRKLAKPESTDS